MFRQNYAMADRRYLALINGHHSSLSLKSASAMAPKRRMEIKLACCSVT
ncbi:hypothetical protein KCP71_18605 [Salmonella enterica subsp. enterica]|nr:hypothetical protein KCP71_18605 [Salmonella enterica subsp. enterica]